MEAALKVLNELEREGVVERYAIGGGVATLFYTEPIFTEDLDIFVILPADTGQLVSLTPLYEALNQKGYRPQKEFVVIAGEYVQFLPAYSDLVVDAVKDAKEVRYQDTLTRVVSVEHLIAIALETGRPKDNVRIAYLLEEAEVNRPFLLFILGRYGLRDKWEKFLYRYEQ